MPITREEVARIAELARLKFQEQELDDFIHHFQQILDYFRQLESVDTERVEPTYHALQTDSASTPMREDQVKPSLGSELSLEQAPDALEGQFRVPRVID